MANPYTVLGVSKNATAEEIKQKYRQLARKMHPDLNPNDPKAADKFKEVTSAYEILSDPEKRRRFDAGEIDETGKERAGFGFNPNGFSRSNNTHGFSGFDFGFGSSSSKRRSGFDFFSDMFGGAGEEDIFSKTRSSSRAKRVGEDINVELNISFLEMATGVDKPITLPNGKTLSLKIPAGIETGAVLRMKGQGHKGISENGDALVKINILPHKYFKREGANVILELPITIKEAILGAKVTIPTLYGEVSLSIPTHSSTGSTLRLRAKGLKTPSETGDQLVKIKVVLPEKPDGDLYKFMQKWNDPSPNPRLKLGII
ncbi:MAG: J domain-containing protein [Alphaproteobacteria bacterium]|nr:J domain-containing protein [Alphaproteobacteria bacterium]